MPISKEKFIENFLDELQEQLAVIDAGILTLKKNPEDVEELTRFLRALHTIKGSARMLKFHTIEKIVHGLENVFKGVKEQQYPISRPLIQLVFITSDYVRAGARKIKTIQQDDLPVEPLLAVFESICADQPYTLEGLKLPEDDLNPVSPAGLSSDVAKPGKKGSGVEQDTVRIKLSKTEKMTKLLNNLIIKQFQLRRENDMLNALEQQFRELLSIEVIAESYDRKKVTKHPEYVQKENDVLKNLQQLRKDFALDLAQLEVNTFELQEEIQSLRMLPLQLIMGSLPKMIEETAIALGKEIEFTMSGTEVMIDKVILEKVQDPIIHLVRNAIDHGIETPEEREKKGKPRVGQISIAAYLEGGNILVRIKDDGKGLDFERIREKAIHANPAQEEELRAMDNDSLLSFIFLSGFSTKEKVQELSGRGVGLDIVRHNIEAVKGKIGVQSQRDQGAEFTLTLPLSLATLAGFFVLAANEKFLIPSTFVKEVLIITKAEQLTIAQGRAIKFRNKIIPLYELAVLLGAPSRASAAEKIFVLVVESLGTMIGLVVEAVIQYASLIYKPLPPSLNNLKAIQGIVFDESYNITNILFIPEIIPWFKKIRPLGDEPPTTESVQPRERILVVDDSYSTREIERSILELENYQVTTASDGIEGLERAKEHQFDLIITDVNMPRMDGVKFVEQLRQQAAYKETPVVVVSTVEDPEIRQQFAAQGVASHIVKADFERGNLAMEVKRLLAS